MAAGSSYPVAIFDANGHEQEGNLVTYTDSTNQPASIVNPVSSGALSQLSAWVSGTAKQNPEGYPITVALALTGDATNNAATVAVAISPDNSTFTTLGTFSLAAAVNNTGAITVLNSVAVPTGWYIKLTIGAHASVAQSYYY